MAENESSALKALSIESIPLSFEFIDWMLPVLPPLQKLSLAHCSLNQSALVHFFDLLQENSLSNSIQDLDIAFNTLGPDGTSALSNWLINCNP